VTDYLARVVSSLPDAELEKLPFIKLKGEDNVKTKVVEQWTAFLTARSPDDPVFGPWRDLAKLPVEQFSQQASAILAKWDALPAGLKAVTVGGVVSDTASDVVTTS
jgi:hypothetical protein